MEEQCAAGGAEGQIAKLVENDEVGVGEASGDLPSLSLVLLLFKGVDEFDRREEPHALAVMLDGLDADGGGEMGFARAGATDEDNIVGVLQELATVKLAHERLVDLASGKVKAGKVAIVRKARGFELVGGRPDLPVGRLRLQELRQIGSAPSKAGE